MRCSTAGSKYLTIIFFGAGVLLIVWSNIDFFFSTAEGIFYIYFYYGLFIYEYFHDYRK